MEKTETEMVVNVETGVNGHLPEDRKLLKTENVHFLTSSREKISTTFKQNAKLVNVTLKSLFHVAVLSYLAVAVTYWYRSENKSIDWCDGLGLLILMVAVWYWSILYYKFLKPYYSKRQFFRSSVLPPSLQRYSWKIFAALPAILFATFLIYDTYPNPKRLVSLSGVCVFILSGFVFSKYPSKIDWSVVYRGIAVQILIAILTIRWSVGRSIVHCIGQKAEKLVSYGYKGAAFVYSENLVYHNAVFAFQSLSVIFFIGCIVEILFYYGILQRIFVTWGWILHKQLGTTAIESINCCASSFLGMSEAPLLIKSYLADLTMSELQAVMMGGLSTVAGTVFAAYISFGVNPAYLMTASVMSAPAALSYSKLLYPETEMSKTKSEHLKLTIETENDSVLSAACNGALSCIHLVQSVIANLIAFISFVAFVNGMLSWFGLLVGLQDFTLDVVLSKILVPVALVLGVDPAQSATVARLIALKMTVNEFIAYQELGKMKQLNKLSPRSEFIASYALCSFANPASVGASIAILSSLCPQQRSNITKVAFRSFIGGTVTCFITASIAALLMPDLPDYEAQNITSLLGTR